MPNMHGRHHTCPTSPASGRDLDLVIHQQMARRAPTSFESLLEAIRRDQPRAYRRWGSLTIQREKVGDDDSPDRQD